MELQLQLMVLDQLWHLVRKVSMSLAALFLAALTCAVVRAGAAAAAGIVGVLVWAILAGLILVWSIRRVVYGKLRHPFCSGSEGASSKHGQSNVRRRRNGCEACER